MSHKVLRKEKECLNCGAEVPGRFCSQCGQENLEPHDTFWHLVTHFFFDIFHFDSKFFSSVNKLLLNPGFLPAAYISGKRTTYLNPIKMYVFTSAIFFILFFAFFANTENYDIHIGDVITKKQRTTSILDVKKMLTEDPENARLNNLLYKLEDSTSKITMDEIVFITGLKDTSSIKNSLLNYRSLAHYDTLQRQLSAKKRDSWLKQLLIRRGIKLREKYNASPDEIGKVWLNDFMHKLPYLLFLSLPLFALILKILYWRKKQLYFVDHGIFAIYQYLLSFILLFFVLCFGKLKTVTGLEIFDWLTIIVIVYGGIYLLIAMKRFYWQSASKTFLKFILLNISSFIMMMVLFVLFIFISFLLL